MESEPNSSPSAGPKKARVKYDLNDPRLRPSSASPAAQETFLRRLGRVTAGQPTLSRPGRIARASRVISNTAIPFIIIYSIFFIDWGPNEHVFSGPQRWLKRQKEAFWSLPSDEEPSSGSPPTTLSTGSSS